MRVNATWRTGAKSAPPYCEKFHVHRKISSCMRARDCENKRTEYRHNIKKLFIDDTQQKSIHLQYIMYRSTDQYITRGGHLWTNTCTIRTNGLVRLYKTTILISTYRTFKNVNNFLNFYRILDYGIVGWANASVAMRKYSQRATAAITVATGTMLCYQLFERFLVVPCPAARQFGPQRVPETYVYSVTHKSPELWKDVISHPIKLFPWYLADRVWNNRDSECPKSGLSSMNIQSETLLCIFIY